MMKKFLLKSTVFIGLLFAALVISPAAYAVPTLVQFDHLGTGNYTINNIFEFDWSSAGNLVIEDNLVAWDAGTGTLNEFFAAASVGDKLTFDLHAHSSLTNFIDGFGSVVTNNFGLNSDYEVTATLDGQQTATYNTNAAGDAILEFDDIISGTFQYYLDDISDPNTDQSDVTTGIGFNDGNVGSVPFLEGTLTLVSGSFNGTNGDGSSFLTNTITGYDTNVIQTDPESSNVWLIGTTFDTTIEFVSGIQPSVGVGGVIGDDPYTILADDLILNADASSHFSAVPEPATMLLLGSGLLGLAGFSRRKFKK